MKRGPGSKQELPDDRSIDTSALVIRPIAPDDWSNIVQILGEKGACGGCWCMWWRVPKGGKSWEQMKGLESRERLHQLVEAGAVHAVIAFAADKPVAWCSFGPRNSFPRMKTIRALQIERPEDTWSVICFYVPARWRHRGIALRLLEAATERAFALGAGQVEGYPVVPKNPPVDIPAAFAWTGVPALFQAAGYRVLPQSEASRPIFVKERPQLT